MRTTNMDFKNILNDESVEPTVRRFSSSHDSLSGRHDSISRHDSITSLPSRKRSRSPSQPQPVHAEPSPKRMKAKRQRPTETPIWAQKWTSRWQDQNGGRRNGHMARPEPSAPLNAIPTPAPPQFNSATPRSHPQPLPARPGTASSTSYLAGETREPSYTNTEPNDELTRAVMDFVYQQVVASGLVFNPPPDTEIEIEAKIGTMVDRSTESRYHLPIQNECAIDASVQTFAFRSSMTERQHQHMNNHLNKAVQKSMLKDANRQKMKYIHLRERDKFFNAPNQVLRELPQTVRDKIHKMGSKPRVRLTFEQKTGELKAAIIKIRWADMHVHSPRTEFDWRISISLEMAYLGDTSTLEPAQDVGRAMDGRNKDRLSYEHQGIKIDLTQVTMDTAKEHELEFELPADGLRTEATRMRNGDPAGYENLVKNFVNDIRVATREFPRT